MKTYELIFETDPIDEHLQDTIDEHFDALISGHGASYFVTLSAEGRDSREAALTSAGTLTRLGVHVRRLSEDLVTRSDIAERVGKTPQAVGNWVRGERQAADPFPAPYNYVAGGVWLWGEVNEWLARTHGPADDIAYPTRDDYSAVNYVLTARASEWTGLEWGFATKAYLSWAWPQATTGLQIDVRYMPHDAETVVKGSLVDLTAGRPRADDKWQPSRHRVDGRWQSYGLAG